MFEVRIHGRGGQGAVTAAGILSVAAFLEGRHAQAFPSFGSERMGAPVAAFCRIDDAPVRTREPVMAPDALIVQDATLLHQVDVFAGLAPDGYVLINSTRSIEALGLTEFAVAQPGVRLSAVAAAGLAARHLGRPVPNVVLLGGLVALTGCLGIDSLVTAVEQWFPDAVAAGNVAAAREAFELVGAQRRQAQREEAAHARAD